MTMSLPWRSLTVAFNIISTSILILCICSYFEIYQEKVYDLLDATSFSINSNNNNNTDSKSLQVREDTKFGVYVEGCIEEYVNNPEDAKRILTLGKFIILNCIIE